MKYSIQITSIKPGSNLQTGERFLDVEAQILDKAGEVVTTKRFGYPMNTSEEEIRADLAKALETFAAEVEYNNSAEAEKAKQVEEENQHADELAESLVGKKIK